MLAYLRRFGPGLGRDIVKEEYPGPREGREVEEHLQLSEKSLGQGTKELTITCIG